MTVAYEQFTAMFPEFADSTVYARDSVELWLQGADEAFSGSARRFGSRYALANMLFAAHYLALNRRNLDALASGGEAGAVIGPTQSASVGPISVSYAVSSYTNNRAGWWNLTTYGIQLYQMMRMAAAGGMYIPGYSRFSPAGPRRL
jgi:hypothetical protein